MSGIPTFLIFDANSGELVNKNGRALVADDPEGKNFPWRERTLKENLSSVKYVNNKGEEKSFSDFEGKHLAIYFSAHWVSLLVVLVVSIELVFSMWIKHSPLIEKHGSLLVWCLHASCNVQLSMKILIVKKKMSFIQFFFARVL